MSSPGKSLFFDLSRLRTASEHILTACDCLSRTARRLRQPIAAIATDTVTVNLTLQCNFHRRELGTTGEAASNELARTSEQILAGSYTLAMIASRMQTTIIGLDVPAIAPEIPISAPAVRPVVREPLPSPIRLTTDDEILSFATLLDAGRPDLPSYPHTDTTALDEAHESLHLAVELLPEAMSNPERPAAFLERFAHWIGEYADAISRLDESVSNWHEQYVQLRGQIHAVAGQYVTKLAAAMRGEPQAVDPSPAWLAYRAYTSVALRPPNCADFPSLAVGR